MFYANFNEPGLIYSPELVDWFHKMEIPALCTDTISNEMDFDPETGMQVTLHCALMRNLGVLSMRSATSRTWRKIATQMGNGIFSTSARPSKCIRERALPSTSSRSSEGFTRISRPADPRRPATQTDSRSNDAIGTCLIVTARRAARFGEVGRDEQDIGAETSETRRGERTAQKEKRK